jgi:hypothetical protein
MRNDDRPCCGVWSQAGAVRGACPGVGRGEGCERAIFSDFLSDFLHASAFHATGWALGYVWVSASKRDIHDNDIRNISIHSFLIHIVFDDGRNESGGQVEPF